MTSFIADKYIVIFLIIIMTLFFLRGKVSIEVTALSGLVILIVLDIIPIESAFSGFSSPSIITMVGMYIISAGLQETGTAEYIGRKVVHVTKDRKSYIITAVCLLGVVLSAFMNNIAATAILIPTVISIGVQTKTPISKLLMPLSFATILGGMTTLFGTPSNIILYDLMQNQGIKPFEFADYLLPGGIVCVCGVLFLVFFYDKVLPSRLSSFEKGSRTKLSSLYKVHESLFEISIPKDSNLANKSIKDSHLSQALGLRVIEITRRSEKKLFPTPETVLKAGDVVTVQGRVKELKDYLSFQGVEVYESGEYENLLPVWLKKVSLKVVSSNFQSKTIEELEFRNRYNVVITSIKRDDDLYHTNLSVQTLKAGDEIEVIGSQENINNIGDDFKLLSEYEKPNLNKDTYFIISLKNTKVTNLSLKESKLSKLFDIRVIGILRNSNLFVDIDGDTKLLQNDLLIVNGNREGIENLIKIGALNIRSEVASSDIESENRVVVEALIPPRSELINKSLIELSFKKKYTFQVLAIWRESKVIRDKLSDIKLRIGDALLLHGEKNRLSLLSQSDDFILLGNTPKQRNQKKIPFAVLALVVTVMLSVLKFYPISVASVIGALIVILSKSITINKAYDYVNWTVVLFVATMIPIGESVQVTGASSLITNGILNLFGDSGLYVLFIVLCLLACILSQIMDNNIAVILTFPIVLNIAQEFNADPRGILMGVAIAVSVAFLTPFSHKANLLVMSPGSYKAGDYFRVGGILSIIALTALFIFIPIIYNF